MSFLRSFIVFYLGCSAPLHADDFSLDSISNLKYIEGAPNVSASREDIRISALKKTALKLGIASGFNDELHKITEDLNTLSHSLDGIFDFGALMRTSNVGEFEMFLQPGVVSVIKNKIKVNSDNYITTIDEENKIIKKEKLVAESQNWRNYLYINSEDNIQKPFNAVLPKNKEEESVWREEAKKGWEIGVKQAHLEVVSAARALKKEFIGMIKYTRLSLENKIQSPNLVIDKTNYEASGNTLNINISRYNINSPAVFNNNSGEWEILQLSTRKGFRTEEELDEVK
jgi:defect-in-organelle-trafficking protein DotC